MKTIVQIGSNKGNTDNDPVWKFCQENTPDSYGWELILVEPNPKAIAIIDKNYREAGFNNFTVLNYGASDKEEDLILYVDNDIPGNEASQHSSVYKSHMYKMGHTDQAIVEYKIKCYPLCYFLPNPVEYLQIDTEGHDDKILLGCDFNYFDVDKIQYEHLHLSEDRNSRLLSYLYQFNYKITNKTNEDTTLER